jgi:hypothetical protein
MMIKHLMFVFASTVVLTISASASACQQHVLQDVRGRQILLENDSIVTLVETIAGWGWRSGDVLQHCRHFDGSETWENLSKEARLDHLIDTYFLLDALRRH